MEEIGKIGKTLADDTIEAMQHASAQGNGSEASRAQLS
jgi:hypothetical protein